MSLGPLTPLGATVSTVAALALAGGWWLDSPELVAIGLAGVVAILQAAAWMVVSPDLLARREIEPVRVAQGDAARALLLVQNLSGRRCPPVLVADRVGPSSLSIPVAGLASGAARTTSYPLPTDRRGVIPIGPLTIGHTDPLRLMTNGRQYDAQTVLTVHPRIHPVASLPTGLNRDAEGPTSASSPQGGIAFHSLREYRLGDPMKHIHWKKSAQTGQLLVCHKVIPDEPSLMLVLDTSSRSYSGDGFEDAVRVVASLAMAAVGGGHPLEIRTTGGDVVVSRAGTTRSTVLDLLAGVQASDDDPGLAALSSMVPGRSAVSLGVATGDRSTADLAIVSMVRRRYLMVTAVQVLGSDEPGRTRVDLPGVFTVVCRDSEDFARRWNEVLVR